MVDIFLRRRMMLQSAGGGGGEAGSDIYIYTPMDKMFFQRTIKDNIYIDGQVATMKNAFEEATIAGTEQYPLNIYFNNSLADYPRYANRLFYKTKGQYFNVYLSNNLLFDSGSFLFNENIQNINISFSDDMLLDSSSRYDALLKDLTYFNSELNFKNNTLFGENISCIINNCRNFNSNIIIGDNTKGDTTLLRGVSEDYNATIKIGNNCCFNNIIYGDHHSFNADIYIGDDTTFLGSSLFYGNFPSFNGNVVFGNNMSLNGRKLNLPKQYNGDMYFGNNTYFDYPIFYDMPIYNRVTLLEEKSVINNFLLHNCKMFNSDIIIRPGVTSIDGLVSMLNNFNKSITIPAGCEIKRLVSDCPNFNSIVIIEEGTTKLSHVISGCPEFNKTITLPSTTLDCSEFITSTSYNKLIVLPNNVVDCSNMFQGCSSFNTAPVISEGIENVNYLFYETNNFNQPVIFPSTIKNADCCFMKCYNYNYPIRLYNVLSCNSLLNGSQKFNSPIYFNYVPERSAAWMLGGMTYSALINYDCSIDFNCDFIVDSPGCFNGCHNFNSEINATLKGNCDYFFAECRNFSRPMDFKYVTSAVGMLKGCVNYGKDFPEDQEYKLDFSNCHNLSYCFESTTCLGDKKFNFIMNKTFRDVDISYFMNSATTSGEKSINFYGVENGYRCLTNASFDTVVIDCGQANKPDFTYGFDHAIGNVLKINCGFPYSSDYKKVCFKSAFDNCRIDEIYINIGPQITGGDFSWSFNYCLDLEVGNIHFTGAKLNSKNISGFEMFNRCDSFTDIKPLLREVFSDYDNIYVSSRMFGSTNITSYGSGSEILNLFAVGNQGFIGCDKFSVPQIIINHYDSEIIHADDGTIKLQGGPSQQPFYSCKNLNNFKILDYNFSTLDRNFIGDFVGYDTVETHGIPGGDDIPVDNSHILDIYISKSSPLYAAVQEDPERALNGAFIIRYGKLNYYELTQDYIDYHIDPYDNPHGYKNYGYTIHFFD